MKQITLIGLSLFTLINLTGCSTKTTWFSNEKEKISYEDISESTNKRIKEIDNEYTKGSFIKRDISILQDEIGKKSLNHQMNNKYSLERTKVDEIEQKMIIKDMKPNTLQISLLKNSNIENNENFQLIENKKQLLVITNKRSFLQEVPIDILLNDLNSDTTINLLKLNTNESIKTILKVDTTKLSKKEIILENSKISKKLNSSDNLDINLNKTITIRLTYF